MYALIAAHLAQLFLNWHDDALVLRQRVNFFNDSKSVKVGENPNPPKAMPLSGMYRVFRLFFAAIVLIITLRFDWCSESNKELCDTDVSHATHAFGALSGFLTGCIFLRSRSFKRPIHLLKNFLLIFVYGLSICYIISKHYMTVENGNKGCPWIEYERVCQSQCYCSLDSVTSAYCNSTAGLNCTVSLCNSAT